MLKYQVDHCYSSSFASSKANEISAHLDGTFDFSDISFKNEELVVRYMSSVSGKQILGQQGPEKNIDTIFTYRPYSIGT